LAKQRAFSQSKVFVAAASLGAHLLLFAAFALSIRVLPQAVGLPPIEVTLVRPVFAPPVPEEQPKPLQTRVQPHRTLAPPNVTPLPAPLPPAPVVPPPRALLSNAPDLGDQTGTRAALQDAVLCPHADTLKLDSAQKEHCRKVFRDLGKDGPVFAVTANPHGRHDPPVESHGFRSVMGPPPPRPGVMMNDKTDCGLLTCPTLDGRH
jgi:hypothetical protein